MYYPGKMKCFAYCQEPLYSLNKLLKGFKALNLKVYKTTPNEILTIFQSSCHDSNNNKASTTYYGYSENSLNINSKLYKRYV